MASHLQASWAAYEHKRSPRLRSQDVECVANFRPNEKLVERVDNYKEGGAMVMCSYCLHYFDKICVICKRCKGCCYHIVEVI